MSNLTLEDTTIVVSSYCIKENMDELEKPTVSPGMDVVMVGSIGVGAAVRLAKKYESTLRQKFSASFVEEVFELERLVDTSDYLKLVQEFLAKNDEKALVYEVKEEGAFAGLYETSKFMGKGIDVNIPDIPVWQQAIEVAEVFDVNPYKADGTGALIIVCNRGADMVECLTDGGILAKVIGQVTDNNDKIARNGEEVRYLEPTRVDELANLL